MVWLIVGTVVFLVAHRAIEGLVCSRGDAIRRKFLWDMATAGTFVLLALGTVVLAFLDTSFRQAFGPIVFFGVPISLVSIAVFAFLSYLVYTEKQDLPDSARVTSDQNSEE